MPAGSFTMGASAADLSGALSEGASQQPLEYQTPQHVVSVRGFAVGKYAVTFAEWDACVAEGGCAGYRPTRAGDVATGR